MTAHTVDISCSCGATTHYVGDSPSSHRFEFLQAHEVCRKGLASSSAQVVDVGEIHRSLLALKRRRGARLGLS